jgi:GNAT superfamily N-acetyltransferase
MTMRVRQAEIADLPWLLEQLRMFSDFFGSRRPLFPSDEGDARRALRGLIETQPFFVADDGERLHGFIAAVLTPHPFNASIRTLHELFWWVAPEHRGSRAGALLFQALLELGRREADWIVVSLEARSPINPATLEKRGFIPYERSWLLEVN